MAILAMLLGSFFGLMSAIFGLTVLEISWGTALALWLGLGLAFGLFFVLLPLAYRSRPEEVMAAEHA